MWPETPAVLDEAIAAFRKQPDSVGDDFNTEAALAGCLSRQRHGARGRRRNAKSREVQVPQIAEFMLTIRRGHDFTKPFLRIRCGLAVLQALVDDV